MRSPVRASWILLAAAAWPLQAFPSPAVFDLGSAPGATASVAGQWRFYPGDDPRYADPHLDDAAWPLLRSDRPWTVQGYPHLSGFAWFRFRVTLPPGTEPLALLLPDINAVQYFLDGKPAAAFGCMPPFHGASLRILPEFVPLPGGARAQPRTVLVALRVWEPPAWELKDLGASFKGGAAWEQVGDRAVLRRFDRTTRAQWIFWHSSDLLLCVLYLLAASVAGILFCLRPQSAEYGWFAASALATAAQSCFAFPLWWQNLPYTYTYLGQDFSEALAEVAILFFYQRALRAVIDWRFLAASAALGLAVLSDLWSDRLHALGSWPSQVLAGLCLLPAELWILGTLFAGAARGSLDARLLLAPALLSIGLEAYGYLDVVARSFGRELGFFPYDSLTRSNISITPAQIGQTLFLLSLLAILIHRFARAASEGDRLGGELAAARSMQQVLIPAALPTVPQLHIESAYYPAQEVGGDFFQILPRPCGDTLFVVGDVSGKGLSAALTVSLVVGAIHTMAEYTSSPAEVLAGINRRLYGRSSGFTTCVVVLHQSDGVLVVANAGHLPPYLNGRELPLPNHLPLGLLSEISLEETHFRMHPGDQLTLLTDGVPEAARGGKLFGFERTQKLSAERADLIANAARDFGQNDDITVLRIETYAQDLAGA